MGMGYAGVNTHTVAEETVEKVCGNELKKFLDEVNNAELDIDDEFTTQCIDYDDHLDIDCDEESAKVIIESYKTLKDKFYDKTGLYLTLCAHNSSDHGSRYDDVDGHYWELGGVMEITSEAKAFQEKFGNNSILNTSFVQYG